MGHWGLAKYHISSTYPLGLATPGRIRSEDAEENCPGNGVLWLEELNRFGRRRAKMGRITTRQAQIMLTSISIPDHIAMPSAAPVLAYFSPITCSCTAGNYISCSSMSRATNH